MSVAAPARSAGSAEAQKRAGRRRFWRRAVPAIQAAPATLFLVGFLLAPMSLFVIYSFWKLENYAVVPDWNLDNYVKVFTDPVYRPVLLNTLLIGAMAATIAVVLAYGVGHALRFHLKRWQETLMFVFQIALFSGYLVRIFAWRTILGSQGVLNTQLMNLGIIQEPLDFLLYNRFAAAVVLANFLMPMAILPINANLQNINEAEVWAARDLGCSAPKAFRRVTLPLAWPGIAAAFLLVFVVACGDYLTPRLVGGTEGTMIGQIIASSFLDAFNWPGGAALACVTLSITLMIGGAVKWAGGKVLK